MCDAVTCPAVEPGQRASNATEGVNLYSQPCWTTDNYFGTIQRCAAFDVTGVSVPSSCPQADETGDGGQCYLEVTQVQEDGTEATLYVPSSACGSPVSYLVLPDDPTCAA